MTKVNKKNKKKALRIRGLMYLRGFTFSDVYKALGISRQYLWYIMNGKRQGGKKKQELAELLGVPYEELWGEDK